MAQLREGANGPVDEPRVVVHVDSAGGLDVAAFMLTANGKVRSDTDFVFFNQPIAQGVRLEGTSGNLSVDLTLIPAEIERIAVTLSTDGATPFSGVGPIRLSIRRPDGTELHDFAPSQLDPYFSAVALELYRRAASWKARAVGQGWQAGLAGLVTSFGVDVAEDPSPASAAPPSLPSPPSPATAAATPIVPVAAPTVHLEKVTLDKRGAERHVILRKDGSAQPVHFNLNWNPGTGLLRRPADLDLGCLVELRDGMKTVIQPLGQRFGSRHSPPYIVLDKDDRSGHSVDGENLVICRPDLVRRVLVFALIYEGARDFSSVAARLLITAQDGSETVVPLNAPEPSLKWCAVCMVNGADDGIRLVKEERYFASARFADEHYRFGFSWTAGRK